MALYPFALLRGHGHNVYTRYSSTNRSSTHPSFLTFMVLINFGSYKLELIAVLSFLTETDTLSEKDATKTVNTDSCLST